MGEKLSTWSGVHLEKLTVARLAEKFFTFIEAERYYVARFGSAVLVETNLLGHYGVTTGR
jgi:hypothetical protein